MKQRNPGLFPLLGRALKKSKGLLGEKVHFNVAVLLCFLFRHNKNKERAKEVSEKLRDNRDLQHFLQNTQDVSFSLPIHDSFIFYLFRYVLLFHSIALFTQKMTLPVHLLPF